MKKILVAGGNGMAGHMITTYLKETKKYDVINICHSETLDEKSIILDVLEREQLIQTLLNIKPNIVINCTGILTKQADSNPDLAIYVNAYFPRLLEKLGPKLGFRTIHLSTDCVFSGKKGNYTESDIPDANDMYGRTKALGELKNDRDLTLRTSIIGPELKTNGIGLFNWFMQQKGIVNGYTNVFWTGVTTLELAKAIDRAIGLELTGIIHLVPDNKISKYDLLKKIQNIFSKSDVDIKPFEEIHSDKSLLRTRSSQLVVPDYDKMLTELRKWIQDHKILFKTYNAYLPSEGEFNGF